MKYRIFFSAFLILLAAGGRSLAATNVVIAGADFQAAINAASPGDTFIVQSATYTGNLNFTIPLTVLCSGTNGIQFTGNTTVSAAGTVSFSQVTFVGMVQIQTNSTAVLSQSICSGSLNSSNGTLLAFDCQIASLAGNNGKMTLKRCGVGGNISIVGTSFECLRLTNSMTISATTAADSGLRFVAVQSSFNVLNLSGMTTWLGYDSWISVNLNNCQSYLIGDTGYDLNNDTSHPISVSGGVAYLYNDSLLKSVSDGHNAYEAGPALSLSGCQAIIQNCTIQSVGYFLQYGNWVPYPYAIAAYGGGPITIQNTIARAYNTGYYPSQNGVSTGIYADSGQITVLNYCCITADAPLSGVTTANSIFVDPQLNGDATLMVASPCIHAGNPAAIYNNTDGTRNTIGWTGGPFYNFSNYTNNFPMVFWLSTSNQTVLKGLQTTIPIKIGAAAGH